MTATDSPALLLAHCRDCGAWTFPPQAWGCRVCGAPPERLDARPPPQPPLLRQAVTVRSELAPGLPVPCVIGEVKLAPGVVEEAWIDLPGAGMPEADALAPGSPLRAVPRDEADGRTTWRFVPASGGAA